ncbi:MAG: hypothetical protein R3B67_09335 [Phycisphaerales bacterium]
MPPSTSTITIRPPADYDLARDVCSYGYFVLLPNYWDVRRQSLSRVLEFDESPSACVIDQRSDGSLRVRFDRRLSREMSRHLPARADCTDARPGCRCADDQGFSCARSAMEEVRAGTLVPIADAV